MKKNKTVSQLEKELETLDLSTHVGSDGSRRRLVHPTKSKLLRKLRRENKTMHCVEEYKNADHSLVIYHDEFIGNPRIEYCNLFCLGLHGKYSFYNEDLPETNEMSGSEYESFLKNLKGNSEFLAFPVYCYEHGGVAFNTTGFSCPWDSAMIGFIYTNKWNVYQEYNVRRISPKLKEKLRDIAEAELQELEDYVMGRGYGYYLYDKDDNEIDQCSGFLGDDHEKNGLFESVLMNTDIEFEPEHLA